VAVSVRRWGRLRDWLASLGAGPWGVRVLPHPGHSPPAIVVHPSWGASSFGSPTPGRGHAYMTITTTIDGTAARISLCGEIDYDTLPTLRAALDGLPLQVTDLQWDLTHTLHGRRWPPSPLPHHQQRPEAPDDRDRTARTTAVAAAPGGRRKSRRLRFHSSHAQRTPGRPEARSFVSVPSRGSSSPR